MATKSLTWTAEWTYNAEGGYKQIATYTSGSKKEEINSITISLGTGNALFNAGSTLTGNGSTLSITLRFGDSTISNSQSVSNLVGHSGDSSGYYPTSSDLQSYTFTFSNLEIAANTTYSVYISTPATSSGSTGPVLCIGRSGTANYTEIEDIQYTLTFNANGGSVSPTSYTRPAGTSVTLPTPTKSFTVTFDPNGGSTSSSTSSRSCTLKSWNTKSDGSGTGYSAGSSYTINANTTLYAIWTNPTVGTLPTATRTKCEFHMWTTTKNGSSQVTESTVISANTRVYAKWKYYITYYGNGGMYEDKTEIDSRPVEHGGSYTVEPYMFYIVPEDPDDPPGETLKYFNTAPNDSGTTYNVGSTISNVTSPVSLYAIYQTSSFTVTFTDGYSGTILKTQVVNYNQDATPPPDPVRKGFEFKGWIGNYQNVKSNSAVHAYWGFTPIWYRTKDRQWVKYEPNDK